MAQQTRIIRTVTLPTSELLAALSPLPDGLRAGVWDVRHAPEDLAYEEIDAVVLPYAGGHDYTEPLGRVPNLKLVHTQTTGYDGIREMVGPGVAVVSAAGVHAAATAEMAVALALASLRGIDVAVRDQQQARWNSVRYPGLADRRVTLVGVGGIGAEIARRLEPFEVELTRVGSTARNDEYGHVHGTDELVALAAETEVMIVITPLNDSTRGLIGARVLAALPDGALVVECGTRRRRGYGRADRRDAVRTAQGGHRRRRSGAASGGPSALARPGSPDHPARGREHRSLPAAHRPAAQIPAPAAGRRRKTAESGSGGPAGLIRGRQAILMNSAMKEQKSS